LLSLSFAYRWRYVVNRALFDCFLIFTADTSNSFHHLLHLYRWNQVYCSSLHSPLLNLKLKANRYFLIKYLS
jgi:hypothetical protein